ncbi:hypothetical protein T06_11118 [Trichinella sp. T6]|nr:hypothetical protein T06_11118 [Trichinella sp. T6]
MVGLFNVQCALHDLDSHAHARYLFESVEDPPRLCFGQFFQKLPGTFKDAVSDKETFGTNFM